MSKEFSTSAAPHLCSAGLPAGCAAGVLAGRLLSSNQRPPPQPSCIPVTPASQTALTSDLAAPAAETTPHALHAPQPGATATLIHDLRELFKVKVVGLVLVTGWGGFYLGSMQSGISTLQRGLLDVLLGIGLVSAGAGALNQCLCLLYTSRCV